jgi:hypothetical protein
VKRENEQKMYSSMYDITNSQAVSILFVEVGCLVKAEDLKEEHRTEIEFLLYGEEVGDFTYSEFLEGLGRVAKKIMKSVGMGKLSPTEESVRGHRILFLNQMKVQLN